MTASQIEDRINEAYYQPERQAWDAGGLPETAEIREHHRLIDLLKKEVERKKAVLLADQRGLQCKRLEEFKQDCFVATKLIDHPKRETAWAQAWERGHGNGLYDVYLELCDLAELLL